MRAAALVAALLLASAPLRAFTIYGQDDRVETKDFPDARVRALARGVPAILDNDDVTIVGARAKLNDSEPYGRVERLVRSVRFFGQPNPAECTAALVAPDVVLTAGHCIPTQKACDEKTFVFDFAYDSQGLAPAQVPASSVVDCDELLGARYDKKSEKLRPDWALVRLAHPMPGRPILRLAAGAPPPPGTPLVMIGYPSGLPQKVDTGEARRIGKDGMIKAELDAFHGNSGSPVLDARSLEIVGVLVDGADDTTPASAGRRTSRIHHPRLRVLNTLAHGEGEGESLTPAGPLKARFDRLLRAPAFDGLAKRP